MPSSRSVKTRLRARWVEQAALSLKVKLLPGLSTYEAIAGRISEVGRQIAHGEKPDPNRIGCPLPPPEVEFPEDYSITGSACMASVKAALKRLPQAEAEQLRNIDTARCEDLLSWLRTRVLKGEPQAVQAYVRVLAHIATVNGYAAPSKVEVTGKDGRPVMESDEKFQLMAARLDDSDQLALLSLMNKARGGPERTEADGSDGTEPK